MDEDNAGLKGSSEDDSRNGLHSSSKVKLVSP